MQKKLAIVLAMLMLLSFLAACAGGGTTAAPTGTQAPGQTTTAATTAAATTAPVETEDPGTGSDYPDYLNLDGYVPIIKEGEGKDIVLDVTALHTFLTSSENIEDLFGWRYTDEFMNVKVNLTALDSENYQTKKNLMFSSGEVPDLMLAMGFSPNEMFNYGVVNGQLLALETHLTPQLTPSVLRAFEEWPLVLEDCTAPDDHVYCLPFIYAGGDRNPSALDNFTHIRLYTREPWLAECGVESPETIDEFLEMLRAYKTKTDEIGSDAYPLGVRGASAHILMQFAAANGVISYGSTYGASLALASDEVVLPVLEDWFYDFIEFFKTCYDEGLVSPDLFTMDATTQRALNAEGKLGVIDDTAPYLSDLDNYLDWISINALTLEKGQKPIAPRGYGSAIGGFCVGANTKYPEVCLRWGDYFYTDEGYQLMWAGPLAMQTELLLGDIEGREWDEEKKSFLSIQAERGDFPTAYAYNTNAIYPSNQSYGWDPKGDYYYDVSGVERPEWFWNLESADTHYRYICYNATHDVSVYGYPRYVYMDNESTETVTDVSSLVDDYISSEVAKFVTGGRTFDRTNFEAFQQELVGLGINDYLAIFVDNYK